MRKDKQKAFKLRRSGKSYSHICRILNVSKSTLSDWFSGEEWSKEISLSLNIKNNRNRVKVFVANNKKRWEKWREEAREQARQEFYTLLKIPLFISGLMLYWAEGDSKLKNPVRFTNTDPRMVLVYRKWLTDVLKISKERIKPTLILYPDLSEKYLLDFWAKKIGLPKSQFYKTQYIKSRHKTARLPHGICNISVSSRQLKEKIHVWIDLYTKSV